MRGVPLPNTSKLPSRPNTVGTCVSTSLAVPACANTLLSTMVTRALPLMTITGRLDFTTTSPSIILSGVIAITPRLPPLGISITFVTYPTDVSFTHLALASVFSRTKPPSVLVTVPAMNAESPQFNSTTFTNSIDCWLSSVTLPVMCCATAMQEHIIHNKSANALFLPLVLTQKMQFIATNVLK